MKHIDHTTQYKTVQWMGYEWQLDADGHRKIHPNHPQEYYGEDTVKVSGEDVILGLKYEPVMVGHWNEKIYQSDFARGMIRSVEDFSYGEYILRCSLPKGKWLQSSFWLSSSDSWPPEIDVFEAYSGCCGRYNQIPQRKIENNFHYDIDSLELNMETETISRLGAQRCSWLCVPKPLQTVQYKLIWLPDKIWIYYNGHLVRYVENQDCPDLFEDLNKHNKMKVVINTGIRKEYLDKYNEFKINPQFNPEFKLHFFKYKPIYQ